MCCELLVLFFLKCEQKKFCEELRRVEGSFFACEPVGGEPVQEWEMKLLTLGV